MSQYIPLLGHLRKNSNIISYLYCVVGPTAISFIMVDKIALMTKPRWLMLHGDFYSGSHDRHTAVKIANLL